MGAVERHWGVRFNPFVGGRARYVPTATHAEAVARIRHAIESGEPWARLEASAGLGKSVVLDQVLAEVRSPFRRISRVRAPADGPNLMAELAAGFGVRVPADPSRTSAWRALADATRIAGLQGMGVVLVVDDVHTLDSEGARDLERLAHLDTHAAARPTIVCVGRPGDLARDNSTDLWGLVIGLSTLTRSEAAAYLDAKLADAGREAPTFTPRAVARLHALSRGVPRGLDRLACLALAAGALRRSEILGPEVVERVAAECRLPDGPPHPSNQRPDLPRGSAEFVKTPA